MKTIHCVRASLNSDTLQFRHGACPQPQPPRDKWPTRGGLCLATGVFLALCTLAGADYASAATPFTAGSLVVERMGDRRRLALHRMNHEQPAKIGR